MVRWRGIGVLCAVYLLISGVNGFSKPLIRPVVVPKEVQVVGAQSEAPLLAFPGGGIFFYWQAGAVHYLKDHYDMSKARLVGASAGALTATLAGCGVEMPLAAEMALRMCMDIGIWERPLGLAGVWGSLVERWLYDLLPGDAHQQCDGRVELYVNRVSSPRCLVRERISRYAERGEVVEACMASVHIPFFMDGRPFRRLKQGGVALDGSFLLANEELCLGQPALLLDHSLDEELERRGGAEFVQLVTPEGIKRMMRIGYRYAQRLHESGDLPELHSIRKRPEP